MTPEQFCQIREVFERAMQLPAESRSPYVHEACRSDTELLTELERMIEAAGQSNAPIDRPALEAVVADGTSTAAISDSISGAGAVVGPYHLLDLIGIGGMGEVWLAEQKYPVRRRVALKLIKAGMDTREVVARFESERQALALMDHPAIAKVFDAGSTSQGRPYFAMEYVTGVPITTYCDRHKLTTQERLELFMHVCEGVQHAHQKAIIHRDLKPSNILVTEVDGKAVPKIIDFGVAKAISQPLTKYTLLTRAGSIVGTPEYMSPEQAESAGQDIDTRTDVYSLGVILYELLVGALPLDLRTLSFADILRKLREEDARRPSTKLRMLGEQSSVSARNRSTEVKALTRQLRGDLDAITLKSLEKERSRRYSSPSELAGDIERYLRNEVVAARPASFGYRARKYIRRHRLGVGLAGGLVLLLAIFTIVQAIELRRITRERDRADRVTNFMTSMFKISSPSEARGNKVTAREILDKASKDIGAGLANDPELQAQMMDIMGTVYFGLGLYPRADSLFARAVEIRRRVLGAEHPDTLRSMSSLANTLWSEGRYAEAEKLEREALGIQRRVLGPEHPDTLTSINNLANILDDQGHYAEAEKLNRQVVDIRRHMLGPEHRDTLNSMNDLGNVLQREGRLQEAESLQRQLLDIRRRVLGQDDPDTLISMSNLGNILQSSGQYEQAEKVLREAQPVAARIVGVEHPIWASITYNLACIAARRGQRDEALLLLREAINHAHGQLMLTVQNDPDLKSLHGDPRFEAIAAYARQRVAAAVNEK